MSLQTEYNCVRLCVLLPTTLFIPIISCLSLTWKIRCTFSLHIMLYLHYEFHSLAFSNLLFFPASLPPVAALYSLQSSLHPPEPTKQEKMEGSRTKRNVLPGRGRIKRQIFAGIFRKLKLIARSIIQFILCERWNPMALPLFRTTTVAVISILLFVGLLFWSFCFFLCVFSCYQIIMYCFTVILVICLVGYSYEMNVLRYLFCVFLSNLTGMMVMIERYDKYQTCQKQKKSNRMISMINQ